MPVEIPKPLIPKEKHQSLLHAIRGGWYIKILSDKIPPLRKGNEKIFIQKKEN